MTITVAAIIENGQLKITQPLSLADGITVQVTITPLTEIPDPLAGVIGIGDSGRTEGAAQHDKYIYGKSS